MNFRDKIEEKIFEWVLAALGSVLAALGCYLISYKSKVDNLKTQVEELRGARDRLQHDVDTAMRNLMKIEDDVKRRLTESDDIIAVAGIILDDDNKGRWLNIMSRYQVSKRADKAASEAKNLKDEISRINSVGYRESTQVVETVTSNRGYEAFESRMPTITGVLEALKDHNITRIGIHGMGGIGKTMLVKEVLKQAEKDKLFDKYLFLVVSNDPDLKRIQREIAEQLDLKLEVESELVRRDQLRIRLKQENRVLIILDDIWKYLDLEALGIFSSGDDNKGCKLLLTSRFYNVVCNDMDIQKQFEVEVFLNDEARNLFEKIVGDLAKTSEIKPTMLQIVEECAGLPIAITTVASALKNQKNPRIWKDFLNQLKMSSPREIEGMNEKVYKSIKMSYEFLKSNEAKSLLLLCSLHGEDEDIEVEDLLRYGVGLGLFDNVDTIEGARCRVHSLVERLKDSSLLLNGDDNGTVKMHDVIRDVVINIAAEERHMFTVRTVNELQTRSKRKDTIAISLPYINGDLDVPNQFECSKLELLLLFDQEVDFRIPDSFFEGLKDLKVLKLSKSWSGVLPSSLSSLENLQTLCLTGEVQNAIIIGELKNLKALSLSLSDTERLPKEIGQLTHLQLLDLRECSELIFIPPNVLSNLKRLEELYLPDDVEWEIGAQSTERINAMVSELDHLSHLTKLHICIENEKILPIAIVFERLESYRIAIGSDGIKDETWETSRILKLNISSQSDYGYKVLLRKCETLILDEMKGVKNNLYELDSEGFHSLKHLTVKYNDEIQYIFKSMGVVGSVFPSLESITLRNVNNLERICYTRLPTKTFCNLRVVKVRNCCKLEFIFSSSMVGCFSHLQKMNIEDCEIMSAIVAIEREEEIEVNSDDSIMFANLHSLKLRKLFKLKGFLSNVDSHVLFNGKVVFPILKKLEIEGMDIMNMIWPDQLISDFFGKLETLTVSGCTNLTHIVPPNMLRTLRNLKELKIEKCGSIKEVFDIQGTNNVEESRDIAATELISLTLRNLEKMKHVWSMDSQGIITFGKLRTIKIEGCSSLKSVFPTSMAKALMQLEKLEIKDCATVEEIVAKEEGIETTTLFVFPQLTTLELQNLPKLKSFYPRNHTLEWPSLKDLRIQNCDKLKIFGFNKSRVEETNELGHHASLILQPLFFVEKVVFPILKKLEIEGMDSMNMIWPDQLISDFFGKLETLTVSGCTNLTNIIPPNMLRTLRNLKELKIEKCGSIKEVFDIQGTNNVEESRDIAATELISLTLRNLEKVKHVWSMDPQGIITFGKLRTIEIKGCSSLKSVFPTSVVKALLQLRWLVIKDCATVEDIVAKEEGIETTTLFVFPQLTILELQNLPELKSFYPQNHTSEWPSLKRLCIQKCDKLKIFGSNKSSVEETNGLSHHASLILQPLFFVEKVVFPNLEELEIEGMDSMMMIWPNQLISDCFGKLGKMTVLGCTNLTNIVPPNMLRTLRNLKELKIEKCGSIEEVFDIQGTNNVEESRDIAATELIYLTLRNLEKVKHVWSMDPQGIITFGKLHTIKIEGCSSLKGVFPTSVAKALMQLEELEIKDCATVEEIVTKEEGMETTTLFVFLQLTTVKLQNLPELKSFYPGNHTLECPSLKDLYIEKCNKLKIFGFNKSSVEETSGLGHHASLILQPLFFIVKVVFPNLEELKIIGMDSIMMIWPNQLISDCFGKLEKMTVLDCTNLTNIVSPNMLRTLRNLKELKIEKCGSIKEVFDIQGTNNVEESSDIATTELISLTLRNLEKVKHVWSMDPQGIITFGKLCTIEIEGCSSLKSVFPTSVAKALMQLKWLVIKDCATVEEIVAKEEGIETTTLFLFAQLISLELQNLPELKSFYPGNHTSEWPSLKGLYIQKCDKLKIFGSNKSGVEETNGLSHHASLILQPLFFVKKDKFPNLVYLELDEGDAMNETCGGPSAEFCCNLEELTLWGNGDKSTGVLDFRRLKNIVPFSSTSFHYLKQLYVYECNALISLLTPSTARTLVQLQNIAISSCERMTEIVANEGSEAKAGDEIAFKNLTSLHFENLLSLTAFHLGNRTIKFPSLVEVEVKKCPKLKIFCSGVLSTPKLKEVTMERIQILKKEGDGDLDLNATIKEYWEAKLETCDQKLVEKSDASEGGESEHDANDNLERDTTSEVGDTQSDGE